MHHMWNHEHSFLLIALMCRRAATPGSTCSRATGAGGLRGWSAPVREAADRALAAAWRRRGRGLKGIGNKKIGRKKDKLVGSIVGSPNREPSN